VAQAAATLDGKSSPAPNYCPTDGASRFISVRYRRSIGIDFGVIQITLSAQRLLIGSSNETIVEPIAVAHLRGTRNGEPFSAGARLFPEGNANHIAVLELPTGGLRCFLV
jgi:hypothetical protein